VPFLSGQLRESFNITAQGKIYKQGITIEEFFTLAELDWLDRDDNWAYRIFPTNDPPSLINDATIRPWLLTVADARRAREDERARNNAVATARAFALHLFQTRTAWIENAHHPSRHRITRVLKFLTLLGLYDAAEQFYYWICVMAKMYPGGVDKLYHDWTTAWTPALVEFRPYGSQF